MEFSCCAFYTVCNFGKNDCYWDDKDPEKKSRCRCFRFNNKSKDIKKMSTNIKILDKTIDKSEVSIEGEQLSLF